MKDGYARAREMLRPVEYPETFPKLLKLEALQKSAAAMQERCFKAPINVTFNDGVNHVGVEQRACKLCGDCVTGCNYGAKNTTLMNYLPDAHNHGAEIYTEVSVRRLEQDADRTWKLFFRPNSIGREDFTNDEEFISADIVILGAGTLGSTEILLRTKGKQALSDMVGKHFTGNGDVLGFAYNCKDPINGVGDGSHDPTEMEPVGPCITGFIDTRKGDLTESMVIEEGSIPGALGSLLPEFLSAAAETVSQAQAAAVGGGTVEVVRTITGDERVADSVVLGPHHGAAHNTQTFLVMSNDDGNGTMQLAHDRLRISWPNVGRQPIFEKVNARLQEATNALEGTFIRDPIWSDIFGKKLITVHPLGGCVMAESAEQGVVNHKGQVFRSNAGKSVYENLYVTDGSVIPRPLGVNPLLTISALAERSCSLIASDRGWTIDYALPSAPEGPSPEPLPGIRFSERMAGFISDQVAVDYLSALEQGRQSQTACEFVLTIASEDVAGMLADPSHPAGIFGTVRAGSLSLDPLDVTSGTFELFTPDPTKPETQQMRYQMNLTSSSNKQYRFEGFKEIHDDPGFDIWSDTTTLFVTISHLQNGTATAIRKGILFISPGDFAKQLRTICVTNAKSVEQKLAITAQFGKFFAGTLFEVFGGVLEKPTVFNPDAPPRLKRELRAPLPKAYMFKAGDGTPLRLIRFQAGTRGPVVLSHGLGVSSSIFTIDTIETNLVEYLCAHDFDVWCLDYRASTDLPCSKSQFDGDAIAQFDYPAAFELVCKQTCVERVHAVVHCFGSTTFWMSLLGGHLNNRVKSVVCSQIGPHVDAVEATELKSFLHLPDLLKILGVKSLTAYADTQEGWRERLLDDALKFVPVSIRQRCHSAICHRITFLYSLLYQHENLNALTHDVLYEMFGVANIKALEHLSTIVRHKRIVSFDGRDIYVPQLTKVDIPITFVHGERNSCFLPSSTERTFTELQKNNPALFARHVIPGYGHIDCIFGKNAAIDVYPKILAHLDQWKA